ncbi:hypothetical protein Zmor_022831 [Zophobas morio]|uniref:Uncharacterized protein n=1 Tax=Zophobas morio TaxID=2755281 RepID=A0AA38HZH9_9CUCU|nr:hypothetical protein Zmor_022831 [Zophobas morio]
MPVVFECVVLISTRDVSVLNGPSSVKVWACYGVRGPTEALLQTGYYRRDGRGGSEFGWAAEISDWGRFAASDEESGALFGPRDFESGEDFYL